MNTRSRAKLLAQPQDFFEARPESGAPAGGPGRSSELDPVLTEATDTPAVGPGPGTPPVHTNPPGGDRSVSSRSRLSSQSASTVRAHRLAAEAQLARRHLEREHTRELQYMQQVKQVEQLEMEASLAALEAEQHSRASLAASSRVASWVSDVRNSEHIVKLEPEDSPVLHNKEPVPHFNFAGQEAQDKNTFRDITIPAMSQRDFVHLMPKNDLYSNRPTIYVKKEAPDALPLKADPTEPTLPNFISPHKFSNKYIDLMTFSGKPTEWLMFKRTYEDTKHLFTPTENLARLRGALRGRALESVSALLYTAERPGAVLAALEQTFAQPEIIAQHEIALVRDLPKISFDLKELNSFACRLRNSIAVIDSLEQKEYLYSIEIFHTVLSKLTPILYSQWKDFAYSSKRSLPKLQLLSEFLNIEADKHNKFGLISDFAKRPCNLPFHSSNRRENVNVTSMRSNNNELCRYCKNKHGLTDCKDFKALSLDDKWCWLREARICYKCLKSKSHRWTTCKIDSCGVEGCQRFHNPLLHSVPTPHMLHTVNESPSSSSNFVTDSDNKNKTVTISNVIETESNNLIAPDCTHVFLKIVPVEISGPKGKYSTFALLDDGSTATLIDSEVARHIGASGPTASIKVDGVAGMSTRKSIQHVSFSIRGKRCSETFTVNNAKAIDTLSLFSQTVGRREMAQYAHLTDLIDELTLVDAKPKILLGAEHWYLTVSREIREGSRKEPVASRTALGWVLHGQSSRWTKPIHFVNHVSYEEQRDRTMDELIKDYFRLDSIGISKPETVFTKQERCALEILESTAQRLPSGRFQVGLLWQKDIPNLPDSYPHALSRFFGLERRMERDAELKKGYCSFINNVIDKGYAEECPRGTYHDAIDLSQESIRWYLPHFPVVHPQKNKLRVVHDAAAKTSGISLNSLLLPGPDLLQSLLHILFRFREGRVALTADVREMFPQIKIRIEDRDALRFVWREDRSSELKEYRMTSVIFGAACSPCTALYIKNRNAQEHQKSYPAAAKAIINDHYMDDYLGSMDDENEALQLAADIVTVHKQARMEMRGWISNVPAALAAVPEHLRAAPLESVHVGPEAFVRTLGLIWHPQSDTFGFRIGSQINENEKLTKRRVLSHLMCLYDPLGLLTPLVIQGRILFQQTWRTGIDWDTELQSDAIRRWLSWSKELTEISDFKIPRWYRCGFQGKDISDRQLHVLADASEQAYSCVAYWRFTFTDGSVKLSLIGGKARLAPLKPTSIPRLELQAALIAARFANTVCAGHGIQPSAFYFWSDSTTVLSWIRSDARTFKPFVANRVGEITEITNVTDWKYVPGCLNIADDATRLTESGINLKRWFSGPDFLLLPGTEWPKEPSSREILPVFEELKPLKAQIGLTILDEPSSVVPDPTHFSEWIRLVRATARVYQCAYKFRSLLARFKDSNPKFSTNTNSSPKLPPLTAINIQEAENAIYKKSQIDNFGQELTLMHDSKTLPKSSKLFSLSPVLDQNGLLRLDSRIKFMRNIDYDTASPIILDGRHPAVRLLIRHYHVKAAHRFNEQVCNELKQRYWILRCRSAVRMVARQCMLCTKRRATPQIPPLGDLPEVRLDHHVRPFTNVGLDYFGPVEVSVGRRREKRWIALFTCMTTRGVHLEIVASLTADSAISCLRRFIARRGIPSKILSDNGTSFVGANRHLTEFYSQPVQDFAANNKTEWSFIPPASPFMGGCWERLVRTVKTALMATLNERAPREELLHTILLEAEALVNSRPLTYVTQNDECQSLTPFHFLIGTSSNQQLPARLNDGVFSLRKDWQKVLRLSEHFWTRWLKEYLPSLKPRRAQENPYKNVKVDDVVLVVDSNLPRGVWPIGRVTAIHPGRDGVVRVAEVTTRGGILKRPIRKLALLNPEIIV